MQFQIYKWKLIKLLLIMEIANAVLFYIKPSCILIPITVANFRHFTQIKLAMLLNFEDYLNYRELPSMYWISKLHKNSYKQILHSCIY